MDVKHGTADDGQDGPAGAPAPSKEATMAVAALDSQIPAPDACPLRPTLDEVRQWPAAVDVGDACNAIGLSRSWGYELVKAGEFPARVLRIRGRTKVLTASLVRLLETGEA